MISVTNFIRTLPMPRNQYISLNIIKEEYHQYDDEDLVDYKSNYSSLIGTAVDYLSRFIISGGIIDRGFDISLIGATRVDERIKSNYLLRDILREGFDLTDKSIESAIKLCGYDTVVRAGKHTYVNIDTINPSDEDIKYARIMVQRTLAFLKREVVLDFGTDFSPKVTKTNVIGDLDFLTESGIWDIKAIKNNPTTLDRIQLLTYYVLATRTKSEKFDNLEVLGFYNPKQDISYRIKINDIQKESIEIINQYLDKVI